MERLKSAPSWAAAWACLWVLAACLGCSAGSDTQSAGGSAGDLIDYTTHDAFITVFDGPSDDHEVTLDTRLYLPDNATLDSPQPALIVAHGFGNNKLSTEMLATADYYARHGYVVLTYTSQGFGQSSGCVRLNSFDYDVKDVIGLIDTVFEDPEFQIDGRSIRPLIARDDIGARVGMIGGSNGGGIQANVAIADPRVRVIVPGRTWNSLQYALMPNNRIVPGDPTGFSHQLDPQGVFKQQWTSLFFAYGNAQPAQGNGGCPQEKAVSGDPTEVAGLACLGFPSEVCTTYASLSATGTATDADRALVYNSSAASRIDELRVPTMLVQGLSDTLFNVNDATSTYLSLKQAGVPVAMTWLSAGHGGYTSMPGECEIYGDGVTEVAEACYLPQRALRWLNRWLRLDTSVDTGSEFVWYRNWLAYDESGSAESQYGSAAQYPALNNRRFFLSGSADLVTDLSLLETGSSSFLNPVGGEPASYSETSNFTGPAASPSFADIPPSDPPGQAISYTTSPFVVDMESVGIPRVHLNISNLNGQDMVFFGKVFDVAPDGSARLIRRLIAPVRVPAASVGEPVDFHLLGFSHRFAAGHRMRLTLASTDQTSYNQKLADTMTVLSGGDDPSYLDLPLRVIR